MAELLALVGRHALAAARRPTPPEDIPLDGPALAVLGGRAVAMVLASSLARWLAVRPDPELDQTAGPRRRRGARR